MNQQSMNNNQTEKFRFLIIMKRIFGTLIELTFTMNRDNLRYAGWISDLVHNMPDCYLVNGQSHDDDYLRYVNKTVNCKELISIYLEKKKYISFIFDATVKSGGPGKPDIFIISSIDKNDLSSIDLNNEEPIPQFLLKLCENTFIIIRNSFAIFEQEKSFNLSFENEFTFELFVRTLNELLCLIDTMITSMLMNKSIEPKNEFIRFLSKCPPELQVYFSVVLQRFP